ncbi:MAG: PVC-type heme-binding CxxCH protein, partial [Roseimicrobium sp.]
MAPPKLQLHRWSGDINVPDPVACTVDPQGRVYVTQTTRRKVADLDIREHPQWIARDVGLEDIEQKRAFYHEELAPGKMLRPRGGLKDHNLDGSIDWKDLTVHTERIYRLEDTDGDGTADRKTVFAEGFNTEVTGIAAGILWHDGAIYCTIAPDLWRLRDTNDDGVADEREVLVHGFGHHIAYAGHDMHGLTLGLDGRIYWTIGDKGVNVRTKDGRQVAQPHQGCVLRCEPDGSGFEIFAHGLRNVQEVAFDEHGNLFGIDNDADKPGGEKERFVYITEQSDSGWRCGFQYMKQFCPWMDEGLWLTRFAEQAAHITPPLAHAHDGPAGFAWHPGTALRTAWKGTFFSNQFPSGKMNAFRLVPQGASFKVTEDKLVASGVMGIGMSWGADGRLYMADWVGDYALNDLGAIWAVDDPAGASEMGRSLTEQRLREGFADRDAVEPVALLGDEDQRVRLSAQLEAVKRGDFPKLQGIALNRQQPHLARLHAVWGLGQGMRSGAYAPDLATLSFLLTDTDAEVRAQTVKVMGDAPRRDDWSKKLVTMLFDPAVRVRFQAGIALSKQNTSEAVNALFEAVRTNEDRDVYLRHAYVTGLASCATEEQLTQASSDADRAVRLAVLLALRRNLSVGVERFLDDKDNFIAVEAARAIHDDASITPALPALAAKLEAASKRPEAFVRRALNANFRLGGADEAARVFAFALHEAAPATLREEALLLLKLWSRPPPLDRVDGRARSLGSRDAALVASLAAPQIGPLMALKLPALKALGIQILTGYKVSLPLTTAVAATMEATTPAAVRIEALRLLAEQHAKAEELPKLLETLLSAKATPESLRLVALRMLAQSAPAVAVPYAARLLASGTLLEKQGCLALLALVQTSEADAVLAGVMDKLLAAELPSAVQLDVLEAAQARASSVTLLAEKLAAFEAKRASLAGSPGAYSECLEGGDAAEGKDIVLNHLAANCTACHRVESKEGSQVGPSLSGIGSQRDRAYLL